LASASEFFEILLQKEGLNTGEVILQDATPQVFEIFLDFIYTKDKFPLKQTKPYLLLSLLKCANMWLACEVQQVCESIFLESRMEPKQWIQLYAVSFLLDNKSLMSHAVGVRLFSNLIINFVLMIGFNPYRYYNAITISTVRNLWNWIWTAL